MHINYKNEKLFLELVDGGILTVTYEGKVKNNRTGNWIGKKPSSDNGYHAIGYKVLGKVKHQLVHRLVFLVHGGILTNEFPLVNHIDGNKSNNHFENLEPSNYLHNSQHAIDIGLRPKNLSDETKQKMSKTNSGENASTAKLTISDVENIRFLYFNEKGWSHRKLAEIYGVDHTSIGDVLRNQSFRV